MVKDMAMYIRQSDMFLEGQRCTVNMKCKYIYVLMLIHLKKPCLLVLILQLKGDSFIIVQNCILGMEKKADKLKIDTLATDRKIRSLDELIRGLMEEQRKMSKLAMLVRVKPDILMCLTWHVAYRSKMWSL